MYDKVYTCTHCGRNKHLAQYYYSRLNVKNDNFEYARILTP